MGRDNNPNNHVQRQGAAGTYNFGVTGDAKGDAAIIGEEGEARAKLEWVGAVVEALEWHVTELKWQLWASEVGHEAL